ncbi:MAG: TspO/MBR family protein [Pseudomonadota bacterium]
MTDQETPVRPWARIALLTVPALILLGSASGWLSNSGYGNGWFDALVKPSFMPPGWLFGVAWTILYALMGVALAMILALRPSPRRRNALALFFAQLALNLAWSPIFFGLHDIKLAQVVIFAIAAIAAGAAGQFFRLRRVAGLLLTPYLGWLVFAATLNSTILNLNPDAGSSLFG